MSSGRRLHGKAEPGEKGVLGYVFDLDDLQRRFVVELLLDGLPFAIARSDAFVPGLTDVGDGYYGFGFSLPESISDDSNRMVEVRLANTGETVGETIRIGSASPASPVFGGYVVWVGGLRASGWLVTAPGRASAVRALVDGRVVASATTTSWTYRRQGSVLVAVPAFDMYLPRSFADGRVHRVEVLNDSGQALHGSPFSMLAISDEFRACVINGSEHTDFQTRLAAVDRLTPRSVPFSDWRVWRQNFTKSIGGVVSTPRVIIVLAGGEAEETLASLGRGTRANWTLIHLSLKDESETFDYRTLARQLDLEDGDAFVIFALGGTLFRGDAIHCYSKALSASGSSTLFYADAELKERDRELPLLWPAYDAERQLEQGYGALAFATRLATARAAVISGADSLPAVFLSVAGTHHAHAAAPVHIPEVLVELPSLNATALSKALARAAKSHLSRLGVEARIVERPGPTLPAI